MKGKEDILMNGKELQEMKDLIALQAKQIKLLQKQLTAKPATKTTSKKKATKKELFYNLYNPTKNTEQPKQFKNGMKSVIASLKTNDKKITDEKINELIAKLKKSHQIIYKNRLYLTAKGFTEFEQNKK